MASEAAIILKVRDRVRDPNPPREPIPRRGLILTFAAYGSPPSAYRATLPYVTLPDKNTSLLYKSTGDPVDSSKWTFVDTTKIQLVLAEYVAGVTWFFDCQTMAPRYPDQQYQDAISFALSKLNYDFAPDTAWTITTLPSTHEFLLIKLATIEMCYIRASEATDPDVDETEDKISSVAVPDLSVSSAQRSGDYGPLYWQKLADTLQDEYDGELKAHKIAAPIAVTVGTMTRSSARRGRALVDSRMDRGVAPTGPPTPTYAAGVLSFTWPPVYDTHFAAYILSVRADGGAWEELVEIYDNHEVETSVDKVLAAGDYKARLTVRNDNAIKVHSAEVAFEVT